MSRNLIPLATLAVSAALTATGNPLAGAVAGGLAGNLATDLFKFLHRRVGERFFDGWSGVDENHHVTRALRLAQINALRAVLTDFTAATAGDPDIARQHEARRFTEVLTDFLDRETKAAQAGAFTADEDRAQAIRYEVLQALPDAFDQGLAARRTAQDRPAILDSLKQVQTVVEAGVLAEIRLQTLGPDGATHDRFAGFPPMFGACFAGTDDRDGWFGLFVRDAAAKIKDDGEFERIWNAEQVALVKAIVQADTEVLQEIAARVQRIETILGAPLRSGVTPVARNAASIRNRPTDLLVARYRVIPYIDRGGVLQEALAWARSPETPLPQGRLYVAPGGFGKTRFAIEMLRTLVDEHWTGTFLSPNNTANLGPGALASVMAEPGVTGCLIIVDYAESQIALLQQLAAAAAAAETATPIRILALARSAEGWWQGLQTHEGIATVFVGPDPIALIDRPLDAAERTLFLDTAIAAFQNAFAAVGLTTPPAAPLPIIGRDDDRPLTVAMAAFLAARGNAPTPGLSVFERIFIEERNNWKRVLHAQRDNEPAVDSLHRAAAQITLVQGATRAGAAALIDADPHHRGYDAAARDQSLASLEILFGADNGESLFLRPIEPDLLGEHVAMAALGPKNNGLIEATLTTALSEPSLFPQAVAAIFTVLTRATYDGHDARTVATAKAAIDRTCPVISGLDGAQVRRVEASLPRFAVPLTRLALAVAHRVVDTCENEPELARALSNLAVCLSETGDRSGALTPARRAAEIYQALAQDNPAAYRPDLAGSLNNLAKFLSETGDRSGALTPARRAVEIREALAQDNPAAYLPDLAMSLNNLANRLSETGDRSGALTPARRAVEIREALAQDNPAAYQPDLARSLNNLAILLSETGDRSGALAMARRAAEIYEALAQDNPAAYRPDLAMSLNNLAIRLSETGDRSGALTPARRAAEIDEALAQDNPAAYRPDLAMSLNNLAIRLSETGDRSGALAMARRAAEIDEALAQDNPAAYRPDLAMSLNNLANRLSETGDRSGALAMARRAVEIREALAQDNPAAYQPDLAMSLNNLAIRLSETGDRSGALTPARRAVEIREALAQDNPAAFLPSLAGSLGNLAYFLNETGDQSGAAAVAQRAAEIREKLV